MSDFSITVADWDTQRAAARAIRYEVFVIEQHVPVELEWDDADAVSLHAVARDRDGRAIGTGRLLPDGHIGRMAVLQAVRGRGVGGRLLAALTAQATALGMREIVLNAQTAAVPFYARFGFAAEGEVFMEAGIAHRTMRKCLSRPS